MVVNIGRVLGGDWDYVEAEISAVLAVCRSHKAALKVIFENDFLPEDEYKIKLCQSAVSWASISSRLRPATGWSRVPMEVTATRERRTTT